MKREPLFFRLLASLAIGGCLGMLGLVFLIAHITPDPGLVGYIIARGFGVGIMAIVVGGLNYIWRVDE